jgi:hypothetical protein
MQISETFDHSGGTIELLPSTTEFPILPTVFNPRDRYEIVDSVLPNRISIMVIGPDDYNDCVFVSNNSPLTVGRFRYTASEGATMPLSIQWVLPIQKYQANAFKNALDNRLIAFFSFDSEDNVDMTRYTLDYRVQDIVEPEFRLMNFSADYAGDSLIDVSWNTQGEAFNQGFILWRGNLPWGALLTSPDDAEKSDTIATFRQHVNLTGAGTNSPTENIDYAYKDTADIRDETFIYQLFYQDFSGNIVPCVLNDGQLAIDTVTVPNAVIQTIVSAEPNPIVNDVTNVTFELLDRAFVTAYVVDLQGRREIVPSVSNRVYPRGEHKFEVQFGQYAPAGPYTIVLEVLPDDDISTEFSFASYKVVLVR